MTKKSLLSGVVFPLVSVAMLAQPVSAVSLDQAVEAQLKAPEGAGYLLLAQAESDQGEVIILPEGQAAPEPEAEPQPEPQPEPEPPVVEEPPPPPAEEPAPVEEPAPAPAPVEELEAAPTPQAPEKGAPPAVEQPQAQDVQPEPPAIVEEAPVPVPAPAAPEPAPEAVPTPEPQPEGQEPAPLPVEKPKAQDKPLPEAVAPVVPPEQPVPQPPVGEVTPEGNVAPTGEAPPTEEAPLVIAPQVEEAKPSTPEQLKQAEDIAADPSKTNEIIVLPVDKGAAVLDSDKEYDLSGDAKLREERQRERKQAENVPPPKSDADAQAPLVNENIMPMVPITEQQGERLKERPQFAPPEGVKVWRPEGGRAGPAGQGGNVTNNTNVQQNNVYQDNRTIVQYGDRVVVNSYDTGRIARVGEEPYYERLPGGRIRETVERPDDGMVVTLRNRYGDVIQRSRIDSRGREYVLYYSPQLDREDDERYVYRDPGLDLPPMRLTIPVRDYIIDTTSDPDRDYYDFLESPPVERVERLYSIEEVRHSARIRDKVRRIDLDTITFATGSADISMKEARTLRKVADAIAQVLDKDPAETFLIEGHTDAIGSDQSNLILSDRRAESIANILTDVYGIAPENLVTQGYGERYLKVKTLSAEQQNRRVTIRRVTPLVRQVAGR